MIIWIDAQLSPSLAPWIIENFSIKAVALRDIGLHNASDRRIFQAAKTEGAIIMSKDSDFLDLIYLEGIPPQAIWITCGNTSNQNLKKILSTTLNTAINLLSAGEHYIEIQDNPY
jgi:predicted nuclease of predicted toxin-antitoxin system